MCPVNESNMYLTNKTPDMKTSPRLLLTPFTKHYLVLLISTHFSLYSFCSLTGFLFSPPTKIPPMFAISKKISSLPEISRYRIILPVHGIILPVLKMIRDHTRDPTRNPDRNSTYGITLSD